MCIAPVTTGCGQEKEAPPTLTHYELLDGDIRFSASSRLEVFENNSSGIIFELKDSDGEIAVLEMPQIRLTAKGYAESLADSYKEDGIHSSVQVTPFDSGGDSAYRITADSQDGTVTETDIVQYGDIVLFGLLCTYEKDDTICRKEAETILDSVEYTGSPRKTETELCETSQFTLSADESWFVESCGDTGASLCLYSTDDIGMTSNIFTLEALGDADIVRKADGMYVEVCVIYDQDKEGRTVPERSQEEFLGKPAEKVSYSVPTEHGCNAAEAWFFEAEGNAFMAYMSCPEYAADSYLSLLQPVLDSIVFKS